MRSACPSSMPTRARPSGPKLLRCHQAWTSGPRSPDFGVGNRRAPAFALWLRPPSRENRTSLELFSVLIWRLDEVLNCDRASTCGLMAETESTKVTWVSQEKVL